jgi:hypothetical protein
VCSAVRRPDTGTIGIWPYCGAMNYGDYDYGAFWFSLEPTATAAAADADVLFLGNSRMQFALSTDATGQWFSSVQAKYYLLDFAYNGKFKFEVPLLRKLAPKPSVYIINLDLFFEQSEAQPARAVMQDGTVEARCERKQKWQNSHRGICERFQWACGNEAAFFRSRPTGAWVVTGGRFNSKPVSYDDSIDKQIVQSYVASGDEFLSNLSPQRDCEILTMVPTMNTPLGTAKAIARALGRPLIAPKLSELNTFDESHLDVDSAQRWSAAFLEMAGPQIRKCLSEPPALR